MNLIPEDNGLEFKGGECGQETFPEVIFHEQSALMQTHPPLPPPHTHMYSQLMDKEMHTHTHMLRCNSSRFHIKPGLETSYMRTQISENTYCFSLFNGKFGHKPMKNHSFFAKSATKRPFLDNS